MSREVAVEQLALFMQARDARQWGVMIDGKAVPSWEDVGPLAQAEYRRDADVFLTAAETLGYMLPGQKWTIKSTDPDAYLIGHVFENENDAAAVAVQMAASSGFPFEVYQRISLGTILRFTVPVPPPGTVNP